MIKKLIKPLLSTYFNISAKIIAMALSRRQEAIALTLKIVKELKKDRCVNGQIRKNNYEDVSTWTCEYYVLYIKSHKTNVQGNKDKLHERCLLLKN